MENFTCGRIKTFCHKNMVVYQVLKLLSKIAKMNVCLSYIMTSKNTIL